MSEQTLITANMPPIEQVRNARLPEIYQNAKLTISECARVDECQQWANKFEALASYARQAGDEGLRKMADRIQARAIRRCGDLLREIEKAHGANQNIGDGNGHKVLTRTDAARKAGLSERQHKTAIRVSRIPDDEFQEAVESADPPTATALSERGKQSRSPQPIIDIGDRDPEEFSLSTQGQGNLRRFAEFCKAADPVIVVRGV